MAITKIQTGGIPALAVTHDKLHTDMDLSAKTVTLPSAVTDTITNKLPLAGGTVTGNVTVNSTGTGDNGLFVGPTGYTGSFVYKSSGDAEIAPRSGKDLIFADSTGGTGLVRIKSNGNVLVGRTSNLAGARTLISGTKSGTNGTNGQLVILDEQSYNTTDNGGGISFAGDFYNGGQVVFATIQGVKANNTDANNAGALKFTTKANGANQLEAMRIDSSGNVGIGTDSPRSELSIAANNSGQGAKLTLENTDTSITSNDVIGQIDFYANDGSTNGTGAKVNIKAIATSTAGTVTALTLGVASSASATAVETMRLKSTEVGWSNTTNGFYNKIYGPTSGDIASGYLTYNGSTLRGGFYTNPAHGLTIISDVDMTFRANNANRMTIDTSGRVTMPNQPYFAAVCAGTSAYTTFGTSVALPFNSTAKNEGNHFNTSNYRFTAPVTGKYSFNVGFITNSSSPTGRPTFFVNGNQDHLNIKFGINGSNTGGGGSTSASAIIHLSANDYVDVRSQSGNIIAYTGGGHSSFTGILIN